MPAYVSPGVYVIETDWSDYSPSLNATNVGVMGFASQGPAGKATLITNADQLIQTFGRPDDAEGGQGLIGAYHILDRTNTVYFTRVVTASASVADAAVKIGSCPHVTTVSAFDEDNHYFVMATVKNSAGATVTTDPLLFNVTPASGNALWTGGADAVLATVNARTTPASPISFLRDSSSTGRFIGSYAGSAAELTLYMWSSTSAFPSLPVGTTNADVTAYTGSNGAFSSTDGNVGLKASKGWEYDAEGSGVTASGVTMDPTAASGGAYVTRTLYPGAGYNYSTSIETYGLKTTGLQNVVTGSQGDRTEFVLNKGTGAEESYVVNLVVPVAGTDINPEKVINSTTDETNKTSDYIVGEFAVDNVDRDDVLWSLPNRWGSGMAGDGATSGTFITAGGDSSALPLADVDFIKLVDGTYNFAGGVNGDLGDGSKTFSDAEVKAAFIGNAADGNGVYSYLKEDVDISLLAIPGVTEQNIVNNAISIAADSQEFLVVTNPPMGITNPQTAIAWSNGTAEGRTAALNNSYACVYWPWVKLFNPFTQIDEYVSPDIFAIRQMAFTDSTFDAWFAPAGLVRGRLTKPVDVEVVLTKGDRDALYGPGNVINPVQKFLTEGIVLWGQRTTQRTATALDRINVRRLMIVIRKMLLASTRQFVFEPNDAATWKRITNAVEPLMADIKSRRGVVDFKVICDSSTNTPIRIDRNELWCKVILQPTKAAEVIVFELNLTSATLGTDLPTA
jgi:hypothetical protein